MPITTATASNLPNLNPLEHAEPHKNGGQAASPSSFLCLRLVLRYRWLQPKIRLSLYRQQHSLELCHSLRGSGILHERPGRSFRGLGKEPAIQFDPLAIGG